MKIHQKPNQDGIISLVICMLLMIIISLITLSFATLARREQRQALDKQLSTQAFYAAESGINDATEAIRSGVLTTDVNGCSTEEQDDINPAGVSASLNDTAKVARTCVFVDQSPSQLDGIVGVSNPTVYQIAPAGLASIDIYWENDVTGVAQTFPATIDIVNGPFPVASLWNGSTTPGVLSIQLIPSNFSTPGGLTRAAISAGLLTAYGYPTASNTNNTFSAGATTNGTIMGGACSTSNSPRHCKISINGLTGGYYLKLKAFYDPVHVTIEARDGLGGLLAINGAQVLIDSTGRAGDVVKRIKVYKPVRTPVELPGYVLDVGEDLCKRLQTRPGDTTSDNPNSIAACELSLPSDF